MEAKNFRIGNIVKLPNDDWVKVFNVGDPEGSGNSVNGYNIDLCNPIPLTGKWLLMFGFKKPAHSWIGSKFHLSEWDEYPLNWCVAMNKNNAVIFKKLKYVHELQNLFFALTGQELELKEVGSTCG